MYKYIHRQLLLRELRIARITAEEVKQMMDNGHELVVVNFRGALDHEADPYTIRGALRMTAEELEQRHHEIPRHKDVILFCACPNETTAAKMALMLRGKGITRVRLLPEASTRGAVPMRIDLHKFLPIPLSISQVPALRFPQSPPRMDEPARFPCPSRFAHSVASLCNAP